MGLSVKAYARHRKEAGMQGGTPSAVRKALSRGDILPLPDGSIDPNSADVTWPRSEAPAGQARRGEPRGEPGPSVPQGVSFAEARRRKELALAERHEYAVAEKRRTMIHIDDVKPMLRRPLEAVAMTLRNAPSRHAHTLAAAADIPVPTAHRILEDLVQEVITDLRNGNPSIEGVAPG